MFRFPWGDMHSLNLGWFLQKFNELREDWATAEAGIDGALDAEIEKAEDALSDVFDARDAAAASATAAAGSASAAGTSATAAQNSATAAASSATLANNKANAAGLSEAATAQSAQQAAGSATAAAGSATQAGQSATNAAASETAAGQSATAAAGSATAAGNSATAAGTSETNAAASAQRAEEAANAAEAATVVKSVENVPIASVDDAIADNVVKLVIGITPAQAGSGDPSPSNVRPISGWTQANVYASGEDTSNPTIYLFTLPAAAGTVYGGTLDVTNGVLTVDRAIATIDGSTNRFTSKTPYTTNTTVYAPATLAPNSKKPASSAEIPNMVSNCFKTGFSGNYVLSADVIAMSMLTDGRIVCGFGLSTTITTLEDANAFAQSQPITFVYELDNPVEYSLTPAEVEMLLGQNYIWADTGNVVLLRYYTDTTSYINEQDGFVKAIIAKELDNMQADTALTANDFRIVNNTLYRITAPVASGATLTPGTNCEATTVAAVLKTLLT